VRMVKFLLCVLLTAGCHGSTNPQAPEPDDHPHRRSARWVVPETMDQLLTSYGEAFENGSLGTMAHLHSRDFHFVADPICTFYGSCATPFPWDYADQMRCLQNMFDPQWHVLPNSRRRFEFSIASAQDSAGVVVADAWLTYMFVSGPDGVLGQGRFTLLAREGTTGGLELLEMREHFLGADRASPTCFSAFLCEFSN
jgi:hypothetical protein